MVSSYLNDREEKGGGNSNQQLKYSYEWDVVYPEKLHCLMRCHNSSYRKVSNQTLLGDTPQIIGYLCVVKIVWNCHIPTCKNWLTAKFLKRNYDAMLQALCVLASTTQQTASCICVDMNMMSLNQRGVFLGNLPYQSCGGENILASRMVLLQCIIHYQHLESGLLQQILVQKRKCSLQDTVLLVHGLI